MNQLFIANPYAESHPIDRKLISDNGLRVYRNSPDTMTVQVRTSTEKQGRVSTVNITWAQANELVAFVQAEIDRRQAQINEAKESVAA